MSCGIFVGVVRYFMFLKIKCAIFHHTLAHKVRIIVRTSYEIIVTNMIYSR